MCVCVCVCVCLGVCICVCMCVCTKLSRKIDTTTDKKDLKNTFYEN